MKRLITSWKRRWRQCADRGFPAKGREKLKEKYLDILVCFKYNYKVTDK